MAFCNGAEQRKRPRLMADDHIGACDCSSDASARRARHTDKGRDIRVSPRMVTGTPVSRNSAAMRPSDVSATDMSIDGARSLNRASDIRKVSTPP